MATAVERRVTLRIPEPMAQQIQQLGEDNFRSINSQILYLVHRGLEAERQVALSHFAAAHTASDGAILAEADDAGWLSDADLATLRHPLR